MDPPPKCLEKPAGRQGSPLTGHPWAMAAMTSPETNWFDLNHTLGGAPKIAKLVYNSKN